MSELAQAQAVAEVHEKTLDAERESRAFEIARRLCQESQHRHREPCEDSLRIAGKKLEREAMIASKNQPTS